MPVHDNLGNRMKEYESVSKIKLMKRIPVAIRLDGKAFHTFTKGFKRPFDAILTDTMQETMKYLCENIQGCVLGYTQSDEITLILTDYATFETDAWFDYEVQKLCSISASMATMAFNKFFTLNVNNTILSNLVKYDDKDIGIKKKEEEKYYEVLENAARKGAMFDARCFNISKEEVANLIYWRQSDAIRNSIQMVGQAYYSHKILQNKTCEDIINMLREDPNAINWESFNLDSQRGSCCIKTLNNKWYIDKEIPIFVGAGREYIEKRIYFGEE